MEKGFNKLQITLIERREYCGYDMSFYRALAVEEL